MPQISAYGAIASKVNVVIPTQYLHVSVMNSTLQNGMSTQGIDGQRVIITYDDATRTITVDTRPCKMFVYYPVPPGGGVQQNVAWISFNFDPTLIEVGVIATSTANTLLNTQCYGLINKVVPDNVSEVYITFTSASGTTVVYNATQTIKISTN